MSCTERNTRSIRRMQAFCQHVVLFVPASQRAAKISDSLSGRRANALVCRAVKAMRREVQA